MFNNNIMKIREKLK